MSDATLSAFPKVIICILSSILIVGGVTVAATFVAENNLNTVQKATYEPKSMHSHRECIAEGLYWELEDIVTFSDSIEVGRYNLTTDILQRLPDYGASYYYSFKDNSVLGFLPLNDPSYAIDLWQKNISNDYLILQEMASVLRDEYSTYMKDKEQDNVSDDFTKLCESLGLPFPSIVCTSYDWFKYDGIGTSMPSDKNLKITYVDADRMNLSYGRSAVLHYLRIMTLPQKLAPVTLYFQEKSFFFNNYDKLENSSWTSSTPEIDSHLRKMIKKH